MRRRESWVAVAGRAVQCVISWAAVQAAGSLLWRAAGHGGSGCCTAAALVYRHYAHTTMRLQRRHGAAGSRDAVQTWLWEPSGASTGSTGCVLVLLFGVRACYVLRATQHARWPQPTHWWAGAQGASGSAVHRHRGVSHSRRPSYESRDDDEASSHLIRQCQSCDLVSSAALAASHGAEKYCWCYCAQVSRCDKCSSVPCCALAVRCEAHCLSLSFFRRSTYYPRKT